MSPRPKLSALIIYTSLIIFFSCSKREPVEILKDYEVAFTDNETLLFTYFRIPEEDTFYMKYRTTFEDGIKYVTEYSYTNHRRSSDRKFKVVGNTKELVEDLHYSYDDSLSNTYTVVHSRIKEHRNIDNGNQYKDGRYFIEFSSPDKIVTSGSVVETFLGDTLLQWRNEMRPTLKFSSTTKIRTFFKYLPIFGDAFEFKGEIYFVKDVGIVKVIGYFDGTYYEQVLLDVQKVEEEIILSSLP
jgi:hypothetical protein